MRKPRKLQKDTATLPYKIIENPNGDPHKIGYGRTSKRDQNPQLQEDAMMAEGCGRIYIEQISTRLTDRPGLIAALDYARKGDKFILWKLDRMARTVRELILTAEDLQARGIGFKVITQDFIDTTSSQGKFLFSIFAAFAELERNLISERTVAGLEVAKANGTQLGRREALSPDQKEAARTLRAAGQSMPKIAAALGCSVGTIHKVVKAA